MTSQIGVSQHGVPTSIVSDKDLSLPISSTYHSQIDGQ